MIPKDRLSLLRDEHRGIIRQLDMVGRCLDFPSPVRRRRVRESISELGSLLREHFDDEEKAIYVPLDSRLKGRSPAKELFGDHRAIEAAFVELETARAKGAAVAELRRLLASLRAALNGHLHKEESVAFWLAEYNL